MVAFRASRLVCSEISVMTSVTLLISRADTPSSSIFSEALCDCETAFPVIVRAFSVSCAIWRMVVLISSAEPETALTLPAACSLASATSRMVALICSEAAETERDRPSVCSVPWFMTVDMALNSSEEAFRVVMPFFTSRMIFARLKAR